MTTTTSNDIPTCTLIRGDGIGVEIADVTVRAIEAAGGKLKWEPMPAGMSAVETDKDPLPQKTIDSIQKNRLALKGPLGTPIGSGFRSVNVALRQHFDLYVNMRPSKTFAGVPCRYDNVDLIMVRENTEDLYSGVEHYVDAKRNAAESIAIITRFGSTRIAEYAFELARKLGRKKVTTVHKANILKMTNGLFLECAREVAKKYPEITADEMIVDACCMKLVIDPTKFDVILTMNLFGDIMSDLCAGLVGGLGVAPAGNIGADAAIFEAVHGTAPDIAGKGLANPTALMLSGALMLEYLGQLDAAALLRKGVLTALADGASRTRDLGGQANTIQFTEAVMRQMDRAASARGAGG